MHCRPTTWPSCSAPRSWACRCPLGWRCSTRATTRRCTCIAPAMSCSSCWQVSELGTKFASAGSTHRAFLLSASIISHASLTCWRSSHAQARAMRTAMGTTSPCGLGTASSSHQGPSMAWTTTPTASCTHCRWEIGGQPHGLGRLALMPPFLIASLGLSGYPVAFQGGSYECLEHDVF